MFFSEPRAECNPQRYMCVCMHVSAHVHSDDLPRKWGGKFITQTSFAQKKELIIFQKYKEIKFVRVTWPGNLPRLGASHPNSCRSEFDTDHFPAKKCLDDAPLIRTTIGGPFWAKSAKFPNLPGPNLQVFLSAKLAWWNRGLPIVLYVPSFLEWTSSHVKAAFVPISLLHTHIAGKD